MPPTDLRTPLVTAFCSLSSLAAQANCSRSMQVPMSSTGQSVIINEGAISGIYPELLRSPSGKEGCEFVLSPVPRARQKRLCEIGKADLLERKDVRAVLVRRFDYGVSRQELCSIRRSTRPACSQRASARATAGRLRAAPHHRGTNAPFTRR